jgi:hypothetical protein
MSSKSQGWQSNRVGPYRVLRKWGSSARGEGVVGRIYAALHHATGRPALLVAAKALGHYAPLEEWHLRVRTGTTPSPYVALEVEQAPKGAHPLRQLDEGLDALACALEGLERHPQAAAHLCGPASPRPRNVRSWAWVAAAVLLAAGVLAPSLYRAAQPLPQAPTQPSPAAAAEEALAEPQALPVGGGDGRQPWPTLALDMPRKPFPGQYRVDAQGKCKGRVEKPINGGCWILLGLKPPCGDDAYEHKGGCYWPSIPSAKEPSSTVPRPVPVPAQRAQ